MMNLVISKSMLRYVRMCVHVWQLPFGDQANKMQTVEFGSVEKCVPEHVFVDRKCFLRNIKH